jgi:hypothetical protein
MSRHRLGERFPWIDQQTGVARIGKERLQYSPAFVYDLYMFRI